MMTSLICTVCLDTPETKAILTTTCGHIFCSGCATRQFTTCPTCPVCRRVQTFEQLIRLFPKYGTISPPASSDTPTGPDTQMPQVIPPDPMRPHPQPDQTPQPSLPPLHVTPDSVFSLRISLDVTGTRFPWTQAGVVPTCDKDGSPVFLGVAAFKNGMHPCKIRVKPEGNPYPMVSYDGKEYEHYGTTLLLPFDPKKMEWVRASHGKLPQGRRPVEGGYERIDAEKLYHALAVVDGISVPGKAGDHGHLDRGANVPYDGREHVVPAYEVLCWRD